VEDKPFRSHAALARVVHSAPDAPLNSGIDVSIVQDNKRIAAAELHRCFLQSLPGFSSNRRTRPLATRQCDAFDPRIRNRLCGLFVRKEDVVEKQLFERQRALRNIGRMLDDQNIARHQVRPGDARQLMIREIAWFHAEQHAQRFALYDRLPVTLRELRSA